MRLILFLGVVLLALAILAVPLSARLPQEGLIAWFRSAFASLREPRLEQDEATDVDIEDLLSDDPSVPGYVTPDQLRGRVDDLRHVFTR
ncbi:MAG TPA: hypothetical protein GX743_01355 [Actinomycetales bacterium]|nr:hypothetical protein [Actinomycetales bacterium]